MPVLRLFSVVAYANIVHVDRGGDRRGGSGGSGGGERGGDLHPMLRQAGVLSAGGGCRRLLTVA